jgi:prealbumin domain-containing protein
VNISRIVWRGRALAEMSKKAFAVGTAVFLIAGLVGGVAFAVSVGSGTLGGFEVEGNFVVDTGNNKDWANTPHVTSTDDTADSGFTQGSKELKPADWVCGTGGASPNKGNILRGLVSSRVTGNSAYVDLGFVAENISGGGDVHLNFEFNQKGALPSGPFVPGPCPITREANDLLVTYDFPGGVALPNIQLFKWVPAANPDGNHDGDWVNLNLQASAARAAVNAVSVADPEDGTILPQRFGEATIDLLAALPPGAISGCQTFGFLNVRSRSSGESITSSLQDKLPPTAIDLSTCGKIIVHKVDDRVPTPLPLAGATFGLFTNSGATGSPLKTAVSGADGKATFNDVEPGDYWVKELSPPPGNYTLDPDIVGPITVAFRETVDVGTAFENPIVRQAKIKIDPAQDANQVGQDHLLTVTVTKKGANDNAFVAAPSTLVTLSKVSGPGSFKNGVNTCTTNASGECTVTIVSSSVGLTTVSASANVLVDTKTVAVVTNGQNGSSGPAVKHWVDARLTLTPPQAANRIGDKHTFTAHLEFDMGSGFVDAPAGKTISLSKVSGPGTLSAASCTTDANGECSFDLTSSATGLTTVQAAWNGTIATAEGTANASAAPDQALKRWVDVKLDLTPPSAVNRVGDPHTFTAHLSFDKGDGNGFVDAPAGEKIDFTKSGVGTLSATSCTTAAGGTCTVVLNSSVTGSTTVDASWSGGVVTANGTVNTSATAQATKDWVDALITINPPQDTNEVGDDHVFTISVQQKVGGVTSPAVGVNPVASITSGPGAFVGPDTCTTNAAGECTVVIRSTQSGLTTVQAEATIVVNGKSIVLKTDGVGSNAAPAIKRWVDARLNLTPPEATNMVGDAHIFTADLEFDLGDGKGFVNAPAGETISFDKASGPGAFVDDTCITGKAGTCTVELNSSTSGTTEIKATWAGNVTTAEGSAAITRADTATKHWIDPSIRLVKTADPVTGGPRNVTYTYVVTNTGDSTLTDVVVTDDILGEIGTIDVLEPGKSDTLERTVFVDVDSPTVNIGEACGTHELGGKVCDTDDAEIAVVLGVVELPKTGFALRLWLLLSSVLLAAGAAALTLEETLRRRRWAGLIG